MHCAGSVPGRLEKWIDGFLDGPVFARKLRREEWNEDRGWKLENGKDLSIEQGQSLGFAVATPCHQHARAFSPARRKPSA
jgi:hypothetical protein